MFICSFIPKEIFFFSSISMWHETPKNLFYVRDIGRESGKDATRVTIAIAIEIP